MSPFYYLMLVWALIIGFVVWGDVPTVGLLVGSGDRRGVRAVPALARRAAPADGSAGNRRHPEQGPREGVDIGGGGAGGLYAAMVFSPDHSAMTSGTFSIGTGALNR